LIDNNSYHKVIVKYFVNLSRGLYHVFMRLYVCVLKAMKFLLYDAIEQAPSADS